MNSLYGHRPNKRAGQNFLTQTATAEKFVDTAVHPLLTPLSTVVEIGPGVGAITRVLCARFQRVIAIEKDARLVKLWNETIPKPENLEIHQGDATHFDFAKLHKELGARLCVFGNLPFNVSTLIMQRLFRQWQHIAYAQLTFQKEVAERLMAKSGGRDYGSLTILANVYSNAAAKLTIGKGQYFPVPKVDSKVVGFTFLDQPRVALVDLKPFEAMVRQLFLYRRKTMLNGMRLSVVYNHWQETARQYLQQTGKSEALRVETLDLDFLYAMFQFCAAKQPLAETTNLDSESEADDLED